MLLMALQVNLYDRIKIEILKGVRLLLASHVYLFLDLIDAARLRVICPRSRATRAARDDLIYLLKIIVLDDDSTVSCADKHALTRTTQKTWRRP